MTSLADPDTWGSYASTFLQHTPLLTRLWLGFLDKDWKDTSVLFSGIASKVMLLHLENLVLDGLRCEGEDLSLFLGNSKRLKRLELRNLDITGTKSFSSILDEVKDLDRLTTFQCWQVAQNGFRTAFPTLGEIEISPCYFRLTEEDLDEEDIDGLKDFLMVNVFRYIAAAEEWEGVHQKLVDLSNDVVVTNRTHEPDLDFGSNGYHWFDT